MGTVHQVTEISPEFSTSEVVEQFDFTEADEWTRFLHENGSSPSDLQATARALGFKNARKLFESLAEDSEQLERIGQVSESPVNIENGVISFEATVEESLNFERTETFTENGTVSREFGCVFDHLNPDDGLQGEHAVIEVVSVDTINCTREVFSGVYNQTGPVIAEEDLPEDEGFLSDDRSLQFPGFNCNVLTDSPTLFEPNILPVAGETRRYYKQSFVDPICITITSNTLNIRYTNGSNPNRVRLMVGTLSQPFLFRDLGEQWEVTERSTSPAYTSQRWSVNPIANASFTRVESQFPINLLAAATSTLGPAGALIVLASCGSNLGETTFSSIQEIRPRRDGGAFMSGSGSVTGGCSNLVHERVWHGTGSYAR